jgi:exodeoxyribonuclease VII large subunit
MGRAAGRLTLARRSRLKQTERLLDSLSYQRVLDRGFALISDARGHAVTSAQMLSAGDDITLSMKDGQVAARISGGAPSKAKKPQPPKKADDGKQGSLL